MLKWIEIDLGTLARNAAEVRKRLEPDVGLTAIIKADAYGHGAVPVAKKLLASGVGELGVLDVGEASVLRKGGIRGSVLLLSPPLAEQADEVIRLKLTPTVDDVLQLAALDKAARARGANLGVHVDVDFGLGRWGVLPEHLKALLAELKRFKRLHLAGLSTHIDYVPGKNAVEAEEKLRTFGRIAARTKAAHPKALAHAANSSILLDFPHWQLDRVRVGNLLYGINPTSREVAVESPWRFYARVIALRHVAKGQSIGYASEYVAPRRMLVATLPAGYSDGLTMEPAERLIGLGGGFEYWGVLRGHKVPFVGRCGISHVLVDVSRVPGVALGEPVNLHVRRTAATSRLPRIYKA